MSFERCTQQLHSFWVDTGPLIELTLDVQKNRHACSAYIDMSDFARYVRIDKLLCH